MFLVKWFLYTCIYQQFCIIIISSMYKQWSLSLASVCSKLIFMFSSAWSLENCIIVCTKTLFRISLVAKVLLVIVKAVRSLPVWWVKMCDRCVVVMWDKAQLWRVWRPWKLFLHVQIQKPEALRGKVDIDETFPQWKMEERLHSCLLMRF